VLEAIQVMTQPRDSFSLTQWQINGYDGGKPISTDICGDESCIDENVGDEDRHKQGPKHIRHLMEGIG